MSSTDINMSGVDEMSTSHLSNSDNNSGVAIPPNQDQDANMAEVEDEASEALLEIDEFVGEQDIEREYSHLPQAEEYLLIDSLESNDKMLFLGEEGHLQAWAQIREYITFYVVHQAVDYYLFDKNTGYFKGEREVNRLPITAFPFQVVANPDVPGSARDRLTVLIRYVFLEAGVTSASFSDTHLFKFEAVLKIIDQAVQDAGGDLAALKTKMAPSALPSDILAQYQSGDTPPASPAWNLDQPSPLQINSRKRAAKEQANARFTNSKKPRMTGKKRAAATQDSPGTPAAEASLESEQPLAPESDEGSVQDRNSPARDSPATQNTTEPLAMRNAERSPPATTTSGSDDMNVRDAEVAEGPTAEKDIYEETRYLWSKKAEILDNIKGLQDRVKTLTDQEDQLLRDRADA